MADLQRSRSLKRPAPSQSGRPKRVAMPPQYPDSLTMNTLSTSPRLQLPTDMAPSPSYIGAVPMTSSHTASSYTGSYTHIGSIAMAQAPSQMSNLSCQLSVGGSPTSSHYLLRHPLPYWNDGQAGHSLEEDGLMMDPAKYLQSNRLDINSINSSSAYPFARQSFLSSDLYAAAAAATAGPQSPMSFGALTDTTSMSVQENLFNPINIDAPDMVHIQSQQSFGDFDTDFSADFGADFPPLEHTKHDASADDCVRGAGSVHMPIPAQCDASFGGFDLERNLTAASYLSLASGQSQNPTQGTIGLGESSQVLSAPAMERSTMSVRSNQSARMRDAARRHLSNAGKNQIKPKDVPLPSSAKAPHAAGTGSTVPPCASLSKSSAASSSPASRDGKLKISKARRERPAQKRLFCIHCKKHEDGFRGPHELQRHINRHHDVQRKRYICVDPRDDGMDSSLRVFKPLAQCKNCRDKKQYGADYNAAAHLRRAHFKEHVPRAKGRSQPAQEDSSSFPVMEDLKHWIKEITVSVSSVSSVSSARTSPVSAAGDSAPYLGFDADAGEHDPELVFPDIDRFGLSSSQEQYSLQPQMHDLGLSAVPRQSLEDTAMFSFDEDFMLNDLSAALQFPGQTDFDVQDSLLGF